MSRSGRRPLLLLGALIAVAAVVVSLVVAIGAHHHRRARPSGPYGSGFAHTATWDQPLPGAALDRAHLPYLVNHGALTFFNPASGAFDLAAHEKLTDELVSRAAARGRKLSVYEYFNISFWLSFNTDGLRPYSDAFSPDWLLRTPAGAQIPYRAVRNGPPQGYMLDLRNPALRSWIVSSVTSWMKAAHYRGIVLDGASPLLADNVRGAVAQGSADFGQLLCGIPATTCQNLLAWNVGLGDVVSEVTAALHKLGDRTIYNGIAPGDAHGPSRNLALLKSADGTTNETFCYGALPGRNSKGFESLLGDYSIMRHAAAEKKTVVQITNYQDDGTQAMAQYCTGAFLIGWQPHYSYYIFHQVYGDLDDDSRVMSPENDLRLGKPATAGYQRRGSVLTRAFEHGRVIVNDGAATGALRLTRSYTQYSEGHRVASWHRGQTVHLDPNSAVFLLDASPHRSRP